MHSSGATLAPVTDLAQLHREHLWAYAIVIGSAGSPLSAWSHLGRYGANFVLFFESATKVELCRFDSVSAKSESRRAFHYEQRRNHE